jgi:hypothetical protein
VGNQIVRNRVVSGMAGLELEILIADMAVRCLDRPLSKISFCELPFRLVQQTRHSALPNFPAIQAGMRRQF